MQVAWLQNACKCCGKVAAADHLNGHRGSRAKGKWVQVGGQRDIDILHLLISCSSRSAQGVQDEVLVDNVFCLGNYGDRWTDLRIGLELLPFWIYCCCCAVPAASLHEIEIDID